MVATLHTAGLSTPTSSGLFPVYSPNLVFTELRNTPESGPALNGGVLTSTADGLDAVSG